MKTHLRSNALRRAGARFRAVARGVKRKAPDLTLVRLWLFAVLVGAATAYGVILFRAGINAVSMFSYGANEEMFASGAASVSFLRSWATPIVGGFVVSAILFLADRFGWLEQGRGQGVPEVIEARAVKDGRISLRAGAAAAVVSTISLGVGGSAGREGPAIHIGATIASALDRRFSFSLKDRRTLLGCGAAAAVAASFNAPIAGVLFALEVVMGSYALSVFGPIAAASVTAVIITRSTLGDTPAFAAPDYGAVYSVDALLSAALGLICGVVATIFLLALQKMTDNVRVAADRVKLSYIFLPPLGGVLIGLIGAYYPETLGVGYETVTRTLAGDYTLELILILLALKIAVTAVTLSFRFGGGVFSPGLVIGAFSGAAFGLAVNSLAPFDTASTAFYAMIGMGAACGAIMGAPISTTLIVFELTGDYAITISLMVAVALATLVTQAFVGKSFFHWQLSRRGYDLSEGPQGVLLQTIRVRDVMAKMDSGPLDKEADRLNAHASLGEALARLDELDEAGLPVVEENEPAKMVGYLSRVKALKEYNKALIASHVDYHR
ncbi:MAG: chloride channel protein [Parvularculaceae bacterium]|nr:chloride channel protein [Parvularculaceae bacterium]